jgi:hypothetical protein
MSVGGWSVLRWWRALSTGSELEERWPWCRSEGFGEIWIRAEYLSESNVGCMGLALPQCRGGDLSGDMVLEMPC